MYTNVICSFLVKLWRVLRRFRWSQELLDNLGSEIDAAYEVDSWCSYWIILATCVMESCTWSKGNNGKHTVLNFPYESFPRACGGSFQARCRHCSNRTSTRPRRCFGRPSAGLKSSRLSNEWDLQLAIRCQWQLLWGLWSSTQRHMPDILSHTIALLLDHINQRCLFEHVWAIPKL